MIKEEVDSKRQQIEQSSDPDLVTAVSHVKALVASIAGSPDTCGTSVLSMLNIADLEKIEIVLASGNANFKYEAIMKVLLNHDHTTMKRKESLLVSEFHMLVSVTRLLLMSQFGSEKREMSWQGKGSLQSEITQIIKQKSKAAGMAEAAASAATSVDAVM